MDLLSHPFRLEANGAAATVLDGTDEAHAEAVAVLILTRKGERDLVPDFGVTDPVYDDLSLAEVNVGLLDYGPDVRVTDARITYPSDRTERVELVFEEQE